MKRRHIQLQTFTFALHLYMYSRRTWQLLSIRYVGCVGQTAPTIHNWRNLSDLL